jgi:geranylgeranyl pyrophosphate synthase
VSDYLDHIWILIHCTRRCSSEERSFIYGLVNRAGPYSKHEISKVRRLFEEQGSIEYAHERTLHYVGRAKDVLSSVPDCEARTLLLELSDYLAVRYC